MHFLVVYFKNNILLQIIKDALNRSKLDLRANVNANANANEDFIPLMFLGLLLLQ